MLRILLMTLSVICTVVNTEAEQCFSYTGNSVHCFGNGDRGCEGGCSQQVIGGVLKDICDSNMWNLYFDQVTDPSITWDGVIASGTGYQFVGGVTEVCSYSGLCRCIDYDGDGIKETCELDDTSVDVDTEPHIDIDPCLPCPALP